MRRLVISSALAIAMLAPASAMAIVGFQSPSGNIRCDIFKQGVRCDTFQKSWSPTPKPNSCEFDWGGSIGLGHRGKAHFLCVSDATEQGPALAYGHAIQVHGFRCTSLTSGVRCVSKRSGKGFKVSRESYRFF